jgi:hypothetical protein
MRVIHLSAHCNAAPNLRDDRSVGTKREYAPVAFEIRRYLQ